MAKINGFTYEQYLKTATEEEFNIIKEFEVQGKLSDNGLEEIKNINEDIRILVITATMCKDSATIVPILNNLGKLNEKITIEFLLKKDNEELLKELADEVKVPSIMLLDSNEKVIRKFIEFPKGVKEILNNNPKEKTQELIDEMRSGKYNNLIQEDLINLLTGKNYNYMFFVRKDK